MDNEWECVIVGGGAAGLSAALVLGRARRRTLLIDAGGQSNRAAHGIGGLLGFDGVPPADLYAEGRRELERYPSVEVRDGEVAAGMVGENWLKVAFSAMALGLGLYLVPLGMIANPALIALADTPVAALLAALAVLLLVPPLVGG